MRMNKLCIGLVLMQGLICSNLQATKPRTHIYSIKNNTTIDLFVWIQFGTKGANQAYALKPGNEQFFESEPCISKIEIRKNARTKVTVDSGVLRGGDTEYTSKVTL